MVICNTGTIEASHESLYSVCRTILKLLDVFLSLRVGGCR